MQNNPTLRVGAPPRENPGSATGIQSVFVKKLSRIFANVMICQKEMKNLSGRILKYLDELTIIFEEYFVLSKRF